jgi:lipoprotein Spr
MAGASHQIILKKPVMINRIIPGVISIILFTTGCYSPRQAASGHANNSRAAQPAVVNNNPKFLDNITITPESDGGEDPAPPVTRENKAKHKNTRERNNFTGLSQIQKATALQLKYALLLNTEVEEVRNPALYEFIDDWYGTRYCMGGTTKNCIDCSAFVQLFFSAVYGVSIPRTAREQYSAAGKISKTKLRQGDLLFFNTRGGVSQVGIYLQNNKFVHAATTGGVMISDLFETYYVKHFISAGRIDGRLETAGKNQPG